MAVVRSSLLISFIRSFAPLCGRPSDAAAGCANPIVKAKRPIRNYYATEMKSTGTGFFGRIFARIDIFSWFRLTFPNFFRRLGRPFGELPRLDGKDDLQNHREDQEPYRPDPHGDQQLRLCRDIFPDLSERRGNESRDNQADALFYPDPSDDEQAADIQRDEIFSRGRNEEYQKGDDVENERRSDPRDQQIPLP